MSELSHEDILAALTALGERLAAQGVHAQIFIVGGAAMALAYSDRRLTKDVDAIFEPKAVVYDAAAQVAAALGLPRDWLNDAVKGFMPGADPAARPIYGIPGIEVHVGSPQYLLTMKLLAMRFGEDEEDIAVLLDACGITSAEQAATVLQEAYPLRALPPKTWFFLQQYFGGEG